MKFGFIFLPIWPHHPHTKHTWFLSKLAGLLLFWLCAHLNHYSPPCSEVTTKIGVAEVKHSFLPLCFLLSPCLSIYLLFSLPAIQEQYLSSHLTLIFHSSYSQLWALSLSASGCAPRACRNPDKGGISERCKIQTTAGLRRVLAVWSKDCNLQEKREAGVQVMPK